MSRTVSRSSSGSATRPASRWAPYRELKGLSASTRRTPTSTTGRSSGLPRLDEATLRRLHTDVRGVLDLEPADVLERNRTREPHSDYVNSWGSGAVEISPGEWFPMIEPLAEATTLDAIERFPWPDMDDPTSVAHMTAEAAPPRGRGRVRDHGHALAPVPARAGVRDAGDGPLPDEHGPRAGVRGGAPAQDRWPVRTADGPRPRRGRRRTSTSSRSATISAPSRAC